RDEVQKVFLAGQEPEIEIDNTVKTVKADSAWSLYQVDGGWVDIAVLDTGGIKYSNPYLKNGVYYDPSGSTSDSHATTIAGIIASTHNTYKGVAYGADPIMSGNSVNSDEELIDHIEWALNRDAEILSISLGWYHAGEMDWLDNYLDYVIVSEGDVFAVKSAGNRCEWYYWWDCYITSPGLAYNIMTVGATDDKDTSTWSDDIMAGYSSWKEGGSMGDREKPEVVAPGSPSYHSTKTSSPWVGGGLGSGTSFAAPVVAGQAALMLDESGVSGLQYWPMTVKAIIMATAWNNIEGDSSRSEFDGTGSVDVSRSVYVTRYDRWDARTISSSSLPLAYSIYAYAGERVRAAISWTSMPVDSNGDLIPESNDIVDIDLNAKDSSNRLLDASYSYRNNYEIVEFTAPYYGYYTINVRCIACPSFSNVELGFAYDRLY
ncbi:MAG: S8 family peptidase, partial [Candidatus Kariarchaeaceae archaeon]